MQLKEIIVENYMQALLKAALLLGDPERTEAIRRIAVCAYRPDDSARRPLPRCLIFHELTLPSPRRALAIRQTGTSNTASSTPKQENAVRQRAVFPKRKGAGSFSRRLQIFGAARGGRPIPR